MKLHRPLRNALTLSFIYGFNLVLVREAYFHDFEIPNRLQGRLLGSLFAVGLPVFFLDSAGLLIKYGFLRLTKKRPLSIPFELLAFSITYSLQQGLIEILCLHSYGFSPFVSYAREMILLRTRMAISFTGFLFMYLIGELYGFHLLLLTSLLP